MNWGLTHGRCSRLDLGCFVCLTTKEVIAPDFTLLDKLLVLDAVLVDHVIISASKESTLVVEHFETPSLSVEVRNIDHLFLGSISVDHLDSSIVMPNQDSLIEDVESRCMEEIVKGNLSLESVLTLVALEHGEHIIFTS